jgi:8-oxo-dGTP diphosphatase
VSNSHKHHPHPLPCVRAIIRDDDGRVLLLQRRAGSIGGGGWCLPGGKIDLGQSPEQAVAAEVKEETNLEVDDARLLFVRDSPPSIDGTIHVLELVYECDASGNLNINDESDDYAWQELDEVSTKNVVFGHEQIIARLTED